MKTIEPTEALQQKQPSFLFILSLLTSFFKAESGTSPNFSEIRFDFNFICQIFHPHLCSLKSYLDKNIV